MCNQRYGCTFIGERRSVMRGNKALLSYILGIISIILIIPFLENLSDVLLGKLEVKKADSTIKVLKLNKEIA